MKKNLILSLCLISFISIRAQEPNNNDDASIDMENIMQLLKQDSILKSFHYQTGQVVIGKNLATINVPQGCLYLGPEESKYFMEDILGNPPSEGSLGIMLSDTPSMISGFNWLIDYNYIEDGHVKDDDAKDINYDDLLKQMKEETDEQSVERVKAGYEKVKLIGWAQAPFYDSKNKKLHWAKELHFGDYDENTLNYNIRVLGREGFLEMNIISGMSSFPAVKNDIDKILNSTNFNEGKRYADFNESTDKIAEYGIGGLIVGGILAKTGILAKVGIFLLKIIKPLIIGVIALFGFMGRKFFGKKKEEAQEEISTEETEQ